MSRKDLLIEMIQADDLVFYENPDYDSAILGVDMSSNRVVYDYDLMVDSLMSDLDLSHEDAVDFIDFNTLGSISPIGLEPIVLYRVE